MKQLVLNEVIVVFRAKSVSKKRKDYSNNINGRLKDLILSPSKFQ